MLDRPEAARLIAAVAQGDRAAFRRLYALTAPKLFGVALRMAPDRAAAEDVLQDAFLRIWTKAVTYSPEAGEPVAWMAAIVRHRAIDLLRSRAARGREEGDEALERIAAADRVDGQVADAAILRRCLGELDEIARSCVVAAYCEGRSREELAARYGAPVNTIKTRLRRSLAALRACVDQNG